MRSLIVAFAAISLVVILGGCGGSGRPGVPAVGPADRLAAIAAVEQAAAVAKGPAAESALLAAFQGRPEFVESGVGGGCVWGKFSDGSLHAVCTSRPPEEEGDEKPLRTDWDMGDCIMPLSRQAWVMTTLGTGFTNPTISIKKWLEAVGWQIKGTDPTLAGFSKLTTATGILFVNTHGAIVKQVPVLWTGTKVTTANLPTYQPLIDNGSLITMGATVSKAVQETHYALTPKYISSKLNLGGQCVVFINASHLDHVAMRDAFKTAGATTYLGWNGPVADADANNAARFLFSRMLGQGNSPAPQTPPSRAFGLHDVMAEMVRQRYDVSPRTGTVNATLYGTYFEDSADFVSSLAPCIDWVRIDQYHPSQLIIQGRFGDDAGSSAQRVTVGGSSVTVLQWQRGQIICRLPNTGAGSSGDVQVTWRGRKSNVVPLTEWAMHVQHKYTNYNGALKLYIDMKPRFRADLHLMRQYLNDPAVRQDVNLALYCTPMPSGEWWAVGWYEDPGNHAVTHWTGSGPLDSRLAHGPNMLNASLTLNPAQQTILGNMGVIQTSFEEQFTPPGGAMQIIVKGTNIDPSLVPNAIPFVFKSDWTIEAGSIQTTAYIRGGGISQLKWWECVPSCVPNDTVTPADWSGLVPKGLQR